MDCSPQSEPKQGFVSFESTPTNEISPVDSYKRTLSTCCVDPLRPPDLSECGFSTHSSDFHIPITLFIRSWGSVPSCNIEVRSSREIFYRSRTEMRNAPVRQENEARGRGVTEQRKRLLIA
jgi:hypothetical protein